MKRFPLIMIGWTIGMVIGTLCWQYFPPKSETSKYLHGYKLDLPEELILADSTDCLGVRVDSIERTIYVTFKH